MYRRLYFTFPTAAQARTVVVELERAGVDPEHMHATAMDGIDLVGLPRATQGQRSDGIWRVERLFWYGNLGLFALAALGLALALFTWSPVWVLNALALMLATFLIGERFAVTLPHGHLSDVRVPLGHGEVVLMVDVPLRRVREIERLVSVRHPEAGLGAVGWTLDGLGV